MYADYTSITKKASKDTQFSYEYSVICQLIDVPASAAQYTQNQWITWWITVPVHIKLKYNFLVKNLVNGTMVTPCYAAGRTAVFI